MAKTILKNCILLDGSKNMRPRPGQSIVLNGGLIEEIHNDREKEEEGSRVIDMGERYVMPGFINGGAYLSEEGGAAKADYVIGSRASSKLHGLFGKSRFRMTLSGNASAELKSGVTGICSLACEGGFDSFIRNWYRSVSFEAPELLVSGQSFAPQGGASGRFSAPVPASADEAAAAAAARAGNCDFIRILADDGEVSADPGQLTTLIREAGKQGLRVSVRATRRESVKQALLAGAGIIEQGCVPDDELTELFLKTGAGLMLSFSPVFAAARICKGAGGAAAEEQLAQLTETGKAALKKEIPLGMASGAGAPYVAHTDFYREIALFCRQLELPMQKALQIAAAGNAALLGVSDRTGILAPGKRADLVVTVGNPLDGAAALRDPAGIISNGRPVSTGRVFRGKREDNAWMALLGC